MKANIRELSTTLILGLGLTLSSLSSADVSIWSECHSQNCRELEWTVPPDVGAITDIDCTLKLRPLDEEAYFELHFLSFYSLENQTYTWLNRPSYTVPHGAEYPLIPKELQSLDSDGNLVLRCNDLSDNVYLQELKRSIRAGTYRVLLSDAEPDGRDGIFGVMYSLLSVSIDLKASSTPPSTSDKNRLLIRGSTLGLNINGLVEDTYMYYHLGGRAQIFTTGDTDTFLIIKDWGDRIVVSDDDGAGVGANAKIDFELQAGYYYLVVRGYNEGTHGITGLTVGPDPGYSIGGWLSPKQTYRAALSPEQPVKYIPFYLPTTAWVTLETHPTYSHLDSTLSLYEKDPSGAFIGFDDDSGEDTNSLLRIYLQAGAYVVGIRGYNQGAEGDFELTLKVDGDST